MHLPPDLLPVLYSFAIVAVAVLANTSVGRILRKNNGNRPSEVLLSKLVAARNLVAVVAGLALLFVWVKELASFVLSIAAIAGAMLIVSKEFLMCWLGTVVRTIARPFQVGDIVEIGAWRGKVVDTDFLTTTLLEMGRAQQFTGNHVEIPNSVYLSTPVKNLSVMGAFFLDFLVVPVAAERDIDAVQQLLLDAALPVVKEFQAEASEHLRRVEATHVVDLPSTELRVLIEPVDAKTVNLVLRFGCPAQQRVSVEQRILLAFYKTLGPTKRTPHE